MNAEAVPLWLIGAATRDDILEEHGPYRLRTATLLDAEAVGAHLRAVDRRDLAATTEEPAERMVKRNLLRGAPVFAFDFNQCAAVGGVADRPQGGSVVWLLGTPAFDEGLRTGGWRLCRRWLDVILEGRHEVFNVVPASNVRTVGWLTWLGCRPVAWHSDFRQRGHLCVEYRLVR